MSPSIGLIPFLSKGRVVQKWSVFYTIIIRVVISMTTVTLYFKKYYSSRLYAYNVMFR